jgi:hypothetical protein
MTWSESLVLLLLPCWYLPRLLAAAATSPGYHVLFPMVLCNDGRRRTLQSMLLLSHERGESRLQQ